MKIGYKDSSLHTLVALEKKKQARMNKVYRT